jgi:ubiquinone/menaquinone biosynthesis C-methylase UbiE
VRRGTRLPRAEHAVEILDGPVPLADLARCLADVARLNALFGGRFLTTMHVKRLAAAMPSGRPLTILDVGTGGGDVPRALVRWARRAARRIRVIALDRDAATLGVARGFARDYPEIAFVRGDAEDVPLGTGAVDIAISSLMLHHLAEPAAARHLAEMDRVARRGFVVNDLARSRPGYGLVWLVTRLCGANYMSRHDGPVSVTRAYVPDELRALCDRAGLEDVRIAHYRPLLRHCAIQEKVLAGG